MLTLENIAVAYGKTQVLSDVSVSLGLHSFNVLIGSNGTGKSSLLKAIAGLIPSLGTVKIENDVLALPSERAAKIAYMQQDIGPTSSLTVLEVIILGRLKQLGLSVSSSFRKEAGEMLERLGVSHLAERTLGELSGGQRQLVYVAQCLYRQPKVLLLDEPTAALDLRHQLLVLNAVRDYASDNEVIVIAAMHDLTLCARFAERILCLSGGVLTADGNSEEVLTPKNIETMYGVSVRVNKDSDGYTSVVPVAPIATL